MTPEERDELIKLIRETEQERDALCDEVTRLQDELRVAEAERDNLLRYGIGRAGVEDFGGGV